jgi:nucleotide-binding universal stress UspA family protein
MATLRDIVVVLDDFAANETRLGVAIALAKQHDAHLTGLSALDLLMPARPVARASVRSDTPAAFQLLNWGRASPIDSPEPDRRDAEQAEWIEAAFRDRLRTSGLRGDWRIAGGKVNEFVVGRARHADLVILGQVDPDHPPRPRVRQLLEDVLMTSGGPILVIPCIGGYETVGTNILVGWNNSREAARAVKDAMPFLAKASSVTILEAVPGGGKSTIGDFSGSDVVGYLAHHGISAKTTRTVMASISASDALLSCAADLSADMLVVGGYGHSRLRELILGGVTRELLQHMTLPVLMSH